MATDGIKRSGRATQGVIVMRLREGEHAVDPGPVVGSDDDDSEPLEGDLRRIPGLAAESLNGDQEAGERDRDPSSSSRATRTTTTIRTDEPEPDEE